jgi:ferritin-like metal-binding protein YciE
MALSNPSDLFLYELATAYDAERKGTQLLGEAVARLGDGDVARTIQTQAQDGQQKIRNLEACFQVLGTRPQAIPSATIDGMRAEFQAFSGLDPTPEVMALYSLGAANKLAHLGLGDYRGLVDKAMLMGQTQCAQMLQDNLVMKEESAGRLERHGHEISQRMLASM